MTPEIKKSQTVRVLDVMVYGPAMIYWAWKKELSKTDKVLLTAL